MEPTGHDLLKHDDWAHHAVDVVMGMSAEAQRNLLLHVFRVVAHHDQNPDPAAPAALCRDLQSTVALHGNDAYLKAVQAGDGRPRGESISIKDALIALSR